MRVVGYGGSGTVWQCWEAQFERHVAVKTLDALTGRDGKAQFDKECRALGSIPLHPNVLPVFARGVDARGVPYLVMPFIAAGSLSDRLERTGALQSAEAARLVVKVSRAVQVAHDAGVLHRDVKPENILMSQSDEPLLADFGIARLMSHMNTATHTPRVSPYHVAPELLEGKPASPRSDVYGLASTLYQLIAGKPALYRESDETAWALFFRRLSDFEPEPLHTHGAPPALSEVVRMGMARDPMERPPQAIDFAEALEVALATCCAEIQPGIGPAQEMGSGANGRNAVRGVVAAGPGAADYWSASEKVVAARPPESKPRKRDSSTPGPLTRRLRYTLGVLASVLLAGVLVATAPFRGGNDGNDGLPQDGGLLDDASGVLPWDRSPIATDGIPEAILRSFVADRGDSYYWEDCPLLAPATGGGGSAQALEPRGWGMTWEVEEGTGTDNRRRLAFTITPFEGVSTNFLRQFGEEAGSARVTRGFKDGSRLKYFTEQGRVVGVLQIPKFDCSYSLSAEDALSLERFVNALRPVEVA